MATVDQPGLAGALPVHDDVVQSGRAVVLKEAEALRLLASSLDDSFEEAVDQLISTERRVIVTGVGKSGHIGRKISATLAATGTASFFLHAGEAAHGDLGMVMPGDCLLIVSNSGFTRELRPLIGYARRFDIPIIAIVSQLHSPLARAATVILTLPETAEACPARIAPIHVLDMLKVAGFTRIAFGVRPTGEGAMSAAPRTEAAKPAALEMAWDCPFPVEADRAKVDSAAVLMQATVSAVGTVESVTILSDPGHGFAAAARTCALKQHLKPGTDDTGKPMRTTTKTFRVRFER